MRQADVGRLECSRLGKVGALREPGAGPAVGC